MSVVGSDYDQLKQYNLAEIYNPTRKLDAKPSNGVADKVEANNDKSPSVAAEGSGLKDEVVAMRQGLGDKTSLDSQEAADGGLLTAP